MEVLLKVGCLPHAVGKLSRSMTLMITIDDDDATDDDDDEGLGHD